MIQTIKKILGFSSKHEENFSAKVFNDALAETIDWTPLKKGGTNIRTHYLNHKSDNKVLFSPTFGSYFFIFLFVGFFMYIFFDTRTYIFGLMAIIFLIVGIYHLFTLKMPIYFDTDLNIFSKGYESKFLSYLTLCERKTRKLKDIYALQIVREYCKGNKSSYYSYELNLVLNNGERINLVDHGNYVKLLEDAKKLSEFLGRPLWDSVANKE